MPAPIGPDENQPTQDPGSPEHQAFVYDDSNPIESQSYETEYVPEREFVLMPLFRRIGDLLGIRRREQSQPPYEAEPLSSEVKPDFPAFAGEPPAANAIEEHASSLVPDPVTMQAIQTPAATDTQDGLMAQSQAEPEEEDDVVQMEHEAADAASLPAQEWVQAQEFPAHADEPEAQVVAQFGAAEPTEVDAISENRFEDTAVEQMPVEPPAEAVEANMAPPHRNVVANRREAETSELIASLREATAKIANAISDAAQWLHSKEEEILQKTSELSKSAVERTKVEAPQHTMPVTEANDGANESLPPTTSPKPIWESHEAPAVQREAPWQARPQLLPSVPRRPFWKRVAWAEQFTPQRVAVLGAAVMAIVLVAGISFAKRPAANNLPKQAPRSVEPGGVTLSTHPSAAPATRPASPMQQSAAPQHRAAQSRPARRASTEDDGPEVVTHYYSRKPSPVKQATVAGGVRHYSDMP